MAQSLRTGEQYLRSLDDGRQEADIGVEAAPRRVGNYELDIPARTTACRAPCRPS